ncbi:MAG: T9SS type A sorting domain-containing protein [Bacteroidota bacterium]
MKKLLLITTAILFTYCLNAQIVNIPDANFKAALVNNYAINTNMDTEIQVSEANSFTGTIDVSSNFISDLTGIEYFVALTIFKCTGNDFNILDLSNNVALTQLYCDYNLTGITSINVSNSPLLTVLNCEHSDLSNINISNNTALTHLYCEFNQLSTLDVSNNTSLVRIQCHYNQLTTLDVANNIALTYMDCSGNQLNSIVLSNNTALTNFRCNSNQLITLDVSNNTALNEFRCSGNQLSNIDLSNNTTLTQLYIESNQISSLNLSNNTMLQLLYCATNQLTSLDLSYNTSLTFLSCIYNQLIFLNVRNGNNINMTSFYIYNNPNLYCIEVDDPIWSYANWTNIDPQTSFGSNCLYGIADPDTISGKILIDNNCIIDGTENGLNGIIVKTGPNDFYGITNSLGEYSIYTDTGTYQVEQIIPASNLLLINPLCPIPNYYTVHFDSLGMDTTGINFFNEGIACPYLTIDVNSDRRRRCFTNNTYVHYCNDGFADATGVEVNVQLPDYVIFVSANYSYTIDTLGNYIFDIGTLAQGDCGEIHIIDSVACINGITGLTQCTEAWITPANDCANQLDTAAYNQWDHSSVLVEGECLGDSIIRFTITNTGALGSGDMQSSSEYRIYRDALLVYTGTFQLLGQEELVIDIPADGATYRLEADQHPMHPGNSHPNETIENCGDIFNSTGLVNIFPQDDADVEIEIDCMPIIDSYDPNDKSVSPEGISAHNFLMPGTSLDYVIRFQNTGSDTAFTVVVVDTLSAHLDIATFQAGISSHPYTLDVRGHGQAVLLFQFFNINLPDSTTNEALSHGFVKFKIAPFDTLVNGTVVENTADIYFDYNVPVITNTTFVTISDTVLYGNPLTIYNTQDKGIADVLIFPNPTTGKINIITEGIRKIDVTNIQGKLVLSQKSKDKSQNTIIDLSTQPKGIYIIKVRTERGVAVEKIVLE